MRPVACPQARSGSNRNAARVFLLALTCVIALTADGMVQRRITLKANGIQGIELLPSEYIAGDTVSAINANGAAAILPYTVVVKNTGSLPITGLDIRYEIFTKGDMVVNNFFYGSPVDLADSASFPVIPPGGSAVLGPSHAINEQLMSWRGLRLSDRNKHNVATRADVLSKADQVTISIDSIIRSDGVLHGPDHSGTLLKFQQEVSGYNEFRNELLKRFEKGESDANIIAWLQQNTQAKLIRPGRNQPLDRSVVTKRFLAQQYLTYMAQGRQYAWDLLKAAAPGSHLRRIIKVRKEAQP